MRSSVWALRTFRLQGYIGGTVRDKWLQRSKGKLPYFPDLIPQSNNGMCVIC